MNITHAGKAITIDGVEYELSPITLEDLEYLDDWVRSRVIRAARLSYEGDKSVSPDQQALVIAGASEAALKSSVFSGNGVNQLITPLGGSRFLYRLLYRKTESVTPAQCFSWMMRPDLRDTLINSLLDVFGSAKKGKIADGSDPTKNGSPSTKEPSSENSSPLESSQAK